MRNLGAAESSFQFYCFVVKGNRGSVPNQSPVVVERRLALKNRLDSSILTMTGTGRKYFNLVQSAPVSQSSGFTASTPQRRTQANLVGVS